MEKWNLECPVCGVTSEYNVERWQTEQVCPNCKAELIDDYDFWYADDGIEEEYDMHGLVLKT